MACVWDKFGFGLGAVWGPFGIGLESVWVSFEMVCDCVFWNCLVSFVVGLGLVQDCFGIHLGSTNCKISRRDWQCKVSKKGGSHAPTIPVFTSSQVV